MNNMNIPATNKQIKESLKQHKLWHDSNHEKGKQFNLKHIENYVFDNKELNSSNLSNANINNCEFNNFTFLEYSNLSNANINNCEFNNFTFLEYSNFSYSNINNCKFDNFYLQGISFNSSKLTNCKFINSGLTEVNFSNAKLINCDLFDLLKDEIKSINWENTQLENIRCGKNRIYCLLKVENNIWLYENFINNEDRLNRQRELLQNEIFCKLIE